MDVIVYFDLDGVLADMEGGLMQNTELVGLRKILDDLIDTKFTEYKGLVDDDIKSKFKAELEQNPESPVKELKKAFNKYTSKVFSIAAKPGFYANLPLMEGAKEMVAKAKELTGKLPHILSSPVGDENDPTNPSVQEKKDWVKSNFGDMVDKIIITTDKASVVKDKCCLLIDDRPKYVNVFTAAGGSAILHKKSVDTISQMGQLIPKLSSMKENKKWVMTFESFRKNLSNRINETSVTVEGKEMVMNFGPLYVTLDVDMVDGVVTQVNGDDIEREGIYSYREEDFQEAFEPFKRAGVKFSYTPWRAEDGYDYEGYFTIDAQSLNDAIKNKRITIIADPEDPEEYLEIKK